MKRIGESANILRGAWMIGVAVLTLLIAVSSGFADEGTQQGTGTHMKVSGVVSKVQSGLTTVKTSWGSMTIASTFTPMHLQVGEEVEMQVNENNAVIDVHRKGDPTHAHRFVSGNLTYTSADRKEITLWTPEGEKTFDVQAGRSKMASIEEGTPVTIELNEAGNVIDIHRFTMEMSFDKQPRTRAGYHITVHGVVRRFSPV